MKKISLLLSIILFVSSCGVKQTRKLLTSGNYDAAIQNAVENLRSNKNAKGKQDYVYLLEEAFAKTKNQDINTINNINSYFKDSPNSLQKIYDTYVHTRFWGNFFYLNRTKLSAVFPTFMSP